MLRREVLDVEVFKCQLVEPKENCYSYLEDEYKDALSQ